MKIALFGDINSNYPILKTFFKQTKKEIDKYRCLGDIVHHNSPEGFRWNNDIVKMLNDNEVISVAGNHEKWLLEIINGNYSRLEKYHEKKNLKNYDWNYNQDTIDFLSNLNDQEEIEDILLTHKSATGKWRILPRKKEFEILEKLNKKILVFGHSHKRLHFQKKSDYQIKDNYFDKERFRPKFDKEYDVSEGLHLVNPGNLHKYRIPGGFSECSSYVIYDTEQKKIIFKRLSS